MRVATASILLLSFACVAVCYGGRGIDPLTEFIKGRSAKRWANYGTTKHEYKAVYVGAQEGLKEADMVLSLPGQPQVNFSQYSGYVTVDPDARRTLFYYFAESQDSCSTPLVLWLNGGPGCSSLGSGGMTGLGPFRVNPDGKLFGTTNIAGTMLQMLSSLNPQLALDSLTRIEYKTREMYIAGESYAGHYAPQLASLIMQNNKITNQTVVNLKGITIGNALIDIEDYHRGYYEYLWTHALISNKTHQGIVDYCNFSPGADISDRCMNYRYEAEDAVGDIYPYHIYAPWCSSSYSSMISGYDQCSSDYVKSYLNIPQVQTALHANVTAIPGPWKVCSPIVRRHWKDSTDTLLPTIKELMADGLRVRIYSGDTDSVVSITATMYSMAKMETAVKTPWYPWDTQQEVGGYIVE
ncbi:serine carboxypeptidase-like 40 [Salvia divinorum]|uniref:Carboxypeptidase n=1 Tax=Salvia divinorum TaxID=28513 RepID=A0ABD1GJI6_SALDI